MSGCTNQSYKTVRAVAARLQAIDSEDLMEQGIDLQGKLAAFEGHWQPRTVSEFNGHDVMVVKVQGEYHWHSHLDTDDFFLVLSGQLEIDLEGGRTVRLAPGQLFIVPRGLRHRPRAEQETHLLLIEPTGTPNSGDVATSAPRRVI